MNTTPVMDTLGEFSREQLENEIRAMRTVIVRLQDAITFDPISSLLKPKAFLARAEAEFNRSRRYNRPLTLVIISMLSLDKMKAEHGQFACNHYVSSLADMCESSRREGSDILGRISENQFAVMLTESDMSGCTHYKARVKELLDASKITWEDAPLKSDLKLSAGVLLDADTSFKDLYKRTITQEVPQSMKTAA